MTKEITVPVPNTVQSSQVTPDLIHAVINVLGAHWDGCAFEPGRHQDVGARDVVAATLVALALDRGVPTDLLVGFLRAQAEAMPAVERHDAEAERQTKNVLDFASCPGAVRTDDLCQELIDDVSRRFHSGSEDLRTLAFAHTAAAAIWTNAKLAMPAYPVSIAKAFVDAVADLVRDIVDLAGVGYADRFIAELRTFVEAKGRIDEGAPSHNARRLKAGKAARRAA